MTIATKPRLHWTQTALLASLFVAGTGLVAWSAVRFFNGPAEPTPAIRDIAQEARDFLAERNVKPLSASLESLLSAVDFAPVATQNHALLDQPTPQFDLTDVEGKTVSLDAALAKGPVVVIFYYGYHCNHCVGQLFAIDRDIGFFKELGATVVAISADPVPVTRERFKKYGAFKFPVLSDPANRVAQKFGIYTPASAKAEESLVHGTFIVDRTGIVRWANFGDEPFTDDRSLLAMIARLQGR